jgi:hypothetical protein
MVLGIVVLASITLDPISILRLAADWPGGWFPASKLVRGRGLGLIGDIVVGHSVGASSPVWWALASVVACSGRRSSRSWAPVSCCC